MKDKKNELEHVLDMQLTDDQVKQIEVGWKAFYKNPQNYKKSVVPDMIRLFLAK